MIEQANCQITGVSFRLFTESEAKRLSVLSVSNPTTFDPLGHPIENGLADTSFGPLKRNDFCKTCGLTDSHCLGHFGHIGLPLPVFNPFLMKQLFQVLRMFCFNCHHFLFSRANVEVYIAQLRALNLGLDFVLDDLQEYANELTGINAQFDWNSPEGQTYLRGRLNDKINSEYSLLKSNKEKLFAAEEETAEASSSSSKPSTSTASQVKSDGVPLATLESVEIMNSKNVVEKKQHLFKDFIGGKLVKPGKVCHSCNARKAGMNVINRSLIVLSAAKAAASVAKFNGNNEDSNDSTEGGNNATGINIEMKGKSYLTPAQAREHLRRLWAHEKDTLVRIFPFINLDVEEDLVKMSKGSSKNSSSSCPLDVFFWETIIVSPNRFRPLRFLNGRSFEHYRTSALAELMVVAKSLEYALETAKKNNSGESIARFHGSWQRLQILANRLYDARLDALPDNKAVGVKQILEKKEGLLRKNMMGKRVNFAARSVISPDPYIMVDEIGVPVVFASRLSYPQPVTQWNLHQLQQAVLNGPLVWPGALSVTYEDGYTVRLSPDSVDQRREVAGTLHPPSLAQGMKGVQTVNRHLLSGDVLLLNRQPTLHKPSIMAHKARVLPREKTLRLHYANCKCYNADFDGDEMNAHFPQSELARAEAYGVASVNYQFLVPKDGSPLSGLIQDHIVAGVMLTVRGRFFNKGDYQQLVYGALSFTNRPIRFLPPSILRPAQLWSGKQIISTLVMNLVPEGRPLPSFEIESKIGAKMFISRPPKERGGYFMLGDKEMCESVVVFRRGELLQGVMDKVNFGANKNGLIHVCYELYGGDVHTRLLTSIARLSTNFLQSHHGFTLGIHDILVQAKPNKERRRLIRTAKDLGTKAVADAFNLGSTLSSGELTEREIEEKLAFAATSRDDFYLKQLDAAYKSHTDTLSNAISGACLPKGLVKPFPSNNLQMMIQAGAKGGSVNAIQISALLGQIELEGRRIPLMMSGRTLPSFRPYETHPRAGGFVTGRFLTGIRPQEFFFHCMAGREGLIDTAVKTSRSGYLQRCLIKHLEGLVVNYDLTVRDSEGSVVQWMYGEDGLDVIRSQCLKKAFFPTIRANVEALKPRKEELARLKAIREPAVPKLMRATRREVAEEARAKKEGEAFGTAGGGKESPFRKFEAKMREESGGEVMEKEKLVDAWFSLEAKEKGQYYRETPRTADPVISRYRPDLHFGAISETLDAVIAGYIDSDVHLKSSATSKTSSSKSSPKDESRKRLLKDFKNTLNVCYQRALCAPGEAVGLLAAQSIGEPSTQMTLNTFHFAGRGEMNVTLGVPRLRELLMTASPNISTPSMDIPFRVDVPLGIDLPAEAEKIRLKLNAVRLKDVLEYVDVLEVLEISPDSPLHRFRTYNVRFQFLPRAAYKRRCFTKPAQVLHYMETVFFKAFIEAMHRRMRLLGKSAGLFDTKSLVTRNRGAAAASKAKKSSGGDDDDEEERMMGRGGENSNSNEEMMDPEEKRRVTMGDDDEEDEDAEDLDLDEGEGDTTAMKHTTRLNQEREYEEADQEEMEGSQDDSDQEEEVEEDGKKVKEEVEEESSEVPIKKSSKNSTSAAAHSLLNGGAPGASLVGPAADRRNRVLGLGRGTVVDYVFDTAKELWCEVTLRFELASAAKLDLRSILTEEAAKAYVHRVGRIDRAFLVKDNEAAKRGLPFAQLLKTEGVSLASVVEFERLLDLRRIYTNDMHAIARTYGIEAARAALIREISNVFGVYGISVDGRHLSLIADHMTFTGAIKGMNRGAMDGISPLQAMTFETTTNFLKNSLLLDLKDDLHSPSSRLVIGRPTLVGSGLFETRLDPAVLTGMANPNVTFGTTSAMLHSSRSTSMLGGFGLMTPSGGSSSFLGSGKSAKKGAGNRLSSGSFLGLGGSIDGSLIGTGSSGIGTMGTAGGWSSSASSARKRPGAPLEDFDADEGYSVGGGSSSAGGEGGIALKEELSPPPPVSASKGTKSKGAKSTTSKSTSKKSSKKSSSSATSAAGVATTSSSGPLFATPLAAKRIKFEFDSD